MSLRAEVGGVGEEWARTLGSESRNYGSLAPPEADDARHWICPVGDQAHARSGWQPAHADLAAAAGRISTAAAGALLRRMLDNIDALCADRDRLTGKLPGAHRDKVVGG